MIRSTDIPSLFTLISLLGVAASLAHLADSLGLFR